MKVIPVSRGFGFLSFTIAAVLLTPAYPAAQKASATQAQALADLAAGIVTCSVHPCLGDSEKAVRAALGGRIVTDSVFNYSDLAVAYPETRGTLQGLVEWSFSEGLETISLKIVDFHVLPQVFRKDLERTLPGCQVEADGDGDNDQAEVDEVEKVQDSEWSCEADGKDDQEVFIELFFAPDLVIFEIGS